MFRVKENQFKNAIKNLKNIFKKVNINKVDLISTNVNSFTYNSLIKTHSINLENLNYPKINNLNKKSFVFSDLIKINSNLSFFNNMKLVFKPVEISEINKKKIIKLVSLFHKKTLLPFNKVEIQAIFLDIPVTGNEKISFEEGNLILKERENKLHNNKSSVVIYKKDKNSKSNVVVLNDRD